MLQVLTHFAAFLPPPPLFISGREESSERFNKSEPGTVHSKPGICAQQAEQGGFILHL